jgi:uncharacterized protein YaaR (DUF327 family)
MTRNELEQRAEALKAKIEAQKNDKDKLQAMIDGIRSAVEEMSAIPTLSQLTNLLSAIKNILNEVIKND